jgi:hypothetical protein
MGMHMTALTDSGDAFADVMAILDDGVALADRTERDFMTDGDGLEALHPDGRVALHDPAGQNLAFIDSFDDNNADGILSFVNEKMRCGHRAPPFLMVD